MENEEGRGDLYTHTYHPCQAFLLGAFFGEEMLVIALNEEKEQRRPHLEHRFPICAAAGRPDRRS
jgi:hypothetical protein